MKFRKRIVPPLMRKQFNCWRFEINGQCGQRTVEPPGWEKPEGSTIKAENETRGLDRYFIHVTLIHGSGGNGPVADCIGEGEG